jgi:hypothetical protein
MGWLRSVLGLEPRLNPEEHERVRCEACQGKGVIMSQGGVSERHIDTHRCWKCHGKGFIMVKREPDAVRAALQPSPSTTADAVGTDVLVSPEMLLTATSVLPDSPAAPTAPAAAPPAPKGVEAV